MLSLLWDKQASNDIIVFMVNAKLGQWWKLKGIEQSFKRFVTTIELAQHDWAEGDNQLKKSRVHDLAIDHHLVKTNSWNTVFLTSNPFYTNIEPISQWAPHDPGDIVFNIEIINLDINTFERAKHGLVWAGAGIVSPVAMSC